LTADHAKTRRQTPLKLKSSRSRSKDRCTASSRVRKSRLKRWDSVVVEGRALVSTSNAKHVAGVEEEMQRAAVRPRCLADHRAVLRSRQGRLDMDWPAHRGDRHHAVANYRLFSVRLCADTQRKLGCNLCLFGLGTA